jgi:hypothetical protein
MTIRSFAGPIAVALMLIGQPSTASAAEPTSANNDQLERAFKQFPAADLNGDGLLTQPELRTFHRERAQKMKGRTGSGQGAAHTKVFQPTADELAKTIAAGSQRKGPQLKFAKGNGLRIVTSGHSWVAPAVRTLPGIAAAAGLAGHHQRAHLGGGATGSANAIWLKEFGKFKSDPAKPVLLPAIATGEWDVMTWGSYLRDQPEYFSQWIDVCLKFNPDMKFCLQDGWPRFSSAHLKMKQADSFRKLSAEMDRMVDEYFTPGLKALDKKYPGKVHIIPTGPAVVELIRRYYADELPGFDCVSENLGGKRGIYRDGGHLSRISGAEHLVGYVYYATIYGRSPALIKGTSPKGIPTAIDRQLREIAWEAVTQSPLSGIHDNNNDGVNDK